MPDKAPVIHIVDDEPDIRDSLSMLVRSVGYAAQTYASGADFLQRYRAGAPGCLLLDVRMPGLSGLELQERLAAGGAALPTIIMTGHGDVPMAVRAMKAGAFDFLEKPFNDQVVLERIGQAIDTAQRRFDAGAERASAARRHAQLTPREREVMDGIVAGQLNKTIADRLGLSVRTVELHRAHVMDKMQARSLSALVRMAILLEQG